VSLQPPLFAYKVLPRPISKPDDESAGAIGTHGMLFASRAICLQNQLYESSQPLNSRYDCSSKLMNIWAVAVDCGSTITYMVLWSWANFTETGIGIRLSHPSLPVDQPKIPYELLKFTLSMRLSPNVRHGNPCDEFRYPNECWSIECGSNTHSLAGKQQCQAVVTAGNARLV
jgi:hypothetical protein